MTDAAFRASYADWKVIKGRKVVQVVFELPLEVADEAYRVLGGMPIASNEVWCGIARLAGSSVVEQATVNRPVAGSSPAPSAKRKFDEMPPAQQAGMLCADMKFRKFLDEEIRTPCTTGEQAAEIVREFCNVSSRSDLNAEGGDWRRLVDRYRAWELAA